jgi:glucose-6-phosphate 1-dehydrogenase
MPIIEQLDNAGLSKIVNTKLLLEKPFGLDQENAQTLIHNIENFFTPEQIYRIDHYLQKDSVRALLTKPSFAKVTSGAVERIEIFASEKIGIEGRGDFYEQTGALRDFVQSHLLEVAAMTIHPTERLQALKSFFIDGDISKNVKRGQYIGYREAVKNPDSVVETFVSVVLRSHNLLLGGFSIVLKTGKALDKKSTDITIFYKDQATEIISLNDVDNSYEHVLEDAMNGDKTFFVSQEEVLETWRIIAPIQEAWKKSSEDLIMYEEGSIM